MKGFTLLVFMTILAGMTFQENSKVEAVSTLDQYKECISVQVSQGSDRLQARRRCI